MDERVRTIGQRLIERELAEAADPTPWVGFDRWPDVFRSNNRWVEVWVSSYLAPWWGARLGNCGPNGLRVSTRVDWPAVDETMSHLQPEPTSPEYPGGRVAIAKDDDLVVAAAPSHGVAYAFDRRDRLVIVGRTGPELSLALMRTLREVAAARYLAAGAISTHAAAFATTQGEGAMVLGNKGAGKTSTALIAAVRLRAALVSSDRVWVVPTDGGWTCEGWPTAYLVGLGLLDALGWATPLTQRYREAPVDLHPMQDPAVTNAIRRGDYRRIDDDRGREAKSRLLVSQLTEWFGLTTAPKTNLSHVLRPLLAVEPSLTTSTACTELRPRDLYPEPGMADEFPDFLGLADALSLRGSNTRPESPLSVPCTEMSLGYDVAASAATIERALKGR